MLYCSCDNGEFRGRCKWASVAILVASSVYMGNEEKDGAENEKLLKRNILFSRDPELSRVKGWKCGPCSGAHVCPFGERMVGCCSHVATGIYIAAGVAYDPQWHRSNHLPCNLLHRGMPEMGEQLLAEWIQN